jgi:transposase
MLQAEKNRQRTQDLSLQQSLKRTFRFLEDELRVIDQEIEQFLQEHQELEEQEKLLRSVLYMSTLVATRYNPVIQAHYQQLLKRGKVKKVALTACMRKFLTILNAMMRDQQPFRA